MKKPEQIVDELLESAPKGLLVEASLARVLSHWEGREFCIISWFRDGQSEEDRECAREMLQKEIKFLNLGYVPVIGAGQEPDASGVMVPHSERAFYVPNGQRVTGVSLPRSGKPRPDFLEQMLALARKFNQDWISYGYGNGTGALLRQDGGIEKTWSDFRVGAAQYFTRLARGDRREFHFESIRKNPPTTVMGGYGRTCRGELHPLI